MKITQTFNQRMTIAVQFHQRGQLEDAEKLYLGILSDFPNHPDVLHLMGVSCSQQGKLEKAINYINMAIIFNPNNPEYYCNLGESLRRTGDLSKAVQTFSKAIAINPNFPMAHFNLANTLKQLNDNENAINHYQQAINLFPNNPEFYYNLGNTYRDTGMYKTAIEVYQQALKLNPNLANVHNNLGATLVEWDRTEEALYHYQQAVRLQPDFEEAYSNMSGIYQKLGETQKAIECIDKIQYFHSIKGDLSKNALFDLHKKSIFPIIFENNEEIDYFRNTLSNALDNIDLSQLSDEEIKKNECYPPSIITYQGRDNKLLKEKYASHYIKKFIPKFKREFNVKPHIGFVVTHGHEGVFMKCMAGIINNISKTDFKITIICSEPNGEKILRAVIKSQEVNYLPIPNDLLKAANIVYNNNFDILHYWEIGTDSTNYFLPYFKTANIQCTSWGWPDTSGIPYLDYYISCENFESHDSEKQYSEKLVKLKELPVYYYMPPIPTIVKPRQHFRLSEDHNIYLCAQNLRKVHPDFDEIAFGILEKDQNSIIVFIGDKQKTVSDKFKNRLVKKHSEFNHRIRVMERMDESEYLSLVKRSDVILDTLYYTGGANTNYDAFASGTPVVTMPNNFHRGRYTTGVYEKMNIHDCIAKNKEDYVDIAVNIATNKDLRKNISNRILEESPKLFEDIKAVRELEECFKTLIKNHG